MINDKYINNLIDTLTNTEIDIYGVRQQSYSDGINELIRIFSKHKKEKSTVFFLGNGGSAAIASHMTADFMKNGGMSTYSLYDSAVTTCMGNDYGYENVFSKPLSFFIKKGDLLVAISSSGKSKNIVNACRVVKKHGAEIIAFTGFSENNKVRSMGDCNVYVPSDRFGFIESIHQVILQQIVDNIMDRDGACL